MRSRWFLVVLATAALAGCATTGLAFVQDDRVRIVSPGENERLRLPAVIEWEAEGYDGYFAVFIDHTPMRPNQGLRSLVPEDDPCLARPACPDADWLAQRTIFVTKETSLRVDVIPDRRSNRRASDRHELTIVLLDPDGRRSGESAFVNEFIVERD